MAHIQTFDARIRSLVAIRRGRLAVGGSVVALVRALVAGIVGAKQAVITTPREA